MMVDVERLVSEWLRARTDITDIVGDRVVTVMPNRAAFPMLKVTQIAGSPVYSHPLYLDEAHIQFDAYGGPKVLARELIDLTRQALADELVGDHPGVGVVTCVRFGELMYLPDDAYLPSQPRWIASASIYTHP